MLKIDELKECTYAELRFVLKKNSRRRSTSIHLPCIHKFVLLKLIRVTEIAE
jgi:hypothetical protein